MTNEARLVFGDDGSEAADVAWQWITAHRWPGWHIDLMTADADPNHIEWGEPARPKRWTPPWDRTGPEDAQVEFFTAATDPRAMLAEAKAALVVVGRGTSSYLESLVTGSTSEWLLQHPPAPLAVIRTPSPVAEVTLCVDGSVHATTALHAFLALPLATGADATLLAVDDDRADVADAVEEATALLEGRVKSVRSEIIKGQPTDVILERLSATQPQLVVLGTRGLTGFARLRLGSTASTVVRAAPCNSLVACAD